MKPKKPKETAGSASIRLSSKDPGNVTPTEQMRESLTNYNSNISDCIKDSIKKHGKEADCFIIVITKKEPLMPNIIRNYFFSRLTCPSPDYDQVVYHYHSSSCDIEFLWVIPSRDACIMFKQNALIVKSEERVLLKFVLDFADGTLYKLCKKLNGEKEKSIELEKGV